jgi:hypothetical protein
VGGREKDNWLRELKILKTPKAFGQNKKEQAGMAAMILRF